MLPLNPAYGQLMEELEKESISASGLEEVIVLDVSLEKQAIRFALNFDLLL